MATAASVQPSETECSVCHENFTTPKILPCAHLLCRHCLVTWLKSETDAQCPLCRYAIVDPKDKALKSLDDIADSLPTDLAMEARVECAAILSKDHVCGGCRNSPAKSICLDCGEMLCTGCTIYHGNLQATRHHKVEDLATMTAERLASSRQLACSVHADKTSELYCPTHGAAICHLCATSKHRACPEVTELEEKMQEARAVLAELAATLKAGESKLEGAISELDQYLVDMEKTTQAVLADIDRKCDRLESSVKKCRKRLKELAKGANSEAKRRAEAVKFCLLKRRGQVTTHWRLADRVKDRMPRACGVSNMISTLRDRVQGIDLSTALPADLKAVTKTTLQIDEEAIASIEQQLSKLGKASKEWRFHTNHGKNIVLSNNQRTADRVGGTEDSIVISSAPLTPNALYEMRVEAVTHPRTPTLVCGVTHGNPATLSLPAGDPGGWKDAIVIGYNHVWNYGPWWESTLGNCLDNLPVESCVGLLVDAANSLHLYVNGVHKGVVASGVRQPCHAFFWVHNQYKKVTERDRECRKREKRLYSI